MTDPNREGWKYSKADVFWGEIAPCDHVLQIYENDDAFLDTLAGFVGGGINANDACVVIATKVHLNMLEDKLRSHGLSIPALVDDHRYIPLDAEDMLSTFMVGGWPDEQEFNKAISAVLKKARGINDRKIRAFGEMVAILWAQGNVGATVNLEHLWNKFSASQSFCLFCAYPKAGFTQDITDSARHICSAHTKMISGSEKQLTEIFYSEPEHKQAI
jgi:hypothetical protein